MLPNPWRCSTLGACGAAVAYVDQGGDSPVTVALDGGELEVEWPVTRIPSNFQRLQTISIEELEDELEREAAREEIV